MQRFFPTWTKPCVAVFSNHLQNWNLWFFRGAFLDWVFNFVGGSLWDLPLYLKLGSQIVPQTGPTKVGKKAGPPMEAPLFFWSQAKSAEQLISKIIFPSQHSDVTAFIKNGRAPKTHPKSPQNAKRSNFCQDELYLNSETNFFSLLVFTGSQGSKKLAARAPPRRYFSDENEKA